MKAEEKAKEIIMKHYQYVSGWSATNKPSERPAAVYEGEKMKIGRAKQCALITVDEILNGSWVLGTKSMSRRKFWYEVRDAIINFNKII